MRPWKLFLAPLYVVLYAAPAAAAVVPSPTPAYQDVFFVSRNAFRPSEPQSLGIRISAETAGNYKIWIYNSAGKKIRSLHDEPRNGSSQINAVWDGKNDSGGMVAAGVYIIHAQTPYWTQDRRVAVLR